MTSPRDLYRRVRQLEGEAGGPLTPAEHLELEHLEREYRALFPVPIDDMSQHELDAVIAYFTSYDPALPRLDELRSRSGWYDRQARNARE